MSCVALAAAAIERRGPARQPVKTRFPWGAGSLQARNPCASLKIAMYCAKCGFPFDEGDEYCFQCGAATADSRAVVKKERMRRPEEGRKIAGVCAAVANRYHVSPTVVRVAWVGASLLPFTPGLVAYLACWAAIPRDKKTASRPESTTKP